MLSFFSSEYWILLIRLDYNQSTRKATLVTSLVHHMLRLSDFLKNTLFLIKTVRQIEIKMIKCAKCLNMVFVSPPYLTNFLAIKYAFLFFGKNSAKKSLTINCYFTY